MPPIGGMASRNIRTNAVNQRFTANRWAQPKERIAARVGGRPIRDLCDN